MTRTTKQISLLLLSLSLVSVILIAASLSTLEFRPGNSFPGSGGSEDTPQSVAPVSSARVYSIPLLRGGFALIFLIVMFYLSARLITLANLKTILWYLLALAALLILVYMLPDVTPDQPASIPSELSGTTAVPAFDYSVAPLGQPPQILIWFVITGIALGMGTLIFIVIKRGLSSSKIKAELLQQAEEAVGALQAGMDLRNVIVRCYLQMTHAIQEEQDIERNDTMTAREFEEWLERKGFPGVPVHQLTSLFEKVRYSKQPMGKNDEKVATDSLNEIIQFCRSRRMKTQ